jgi:hypothetical protein
MEILPEAAMADVNRGSQFLEKNHLKLSGLFRFLHLTRMFLEVFFRYPEPTAL